MWFASFTKREDWGRGRFEGRPRVQCTMPLRCSDGGAQLGISVRHAGDRAELVE